MAIDPIARGLAAYAGSAEGISAAGGALQSNVTPVTKRPPGALDDTSHAYAVGDYWSFGGQVWQATRVTAGGASWQPLYPTQALLLDAVNATALCAYGLRKLTSAYAGNCVRVVRASDSTTLDIGFGLDGWVDVAAIFNFIAGTTGRFDIWYDQSGNARNALQTTAARRPGITGQTVNGKPAILIDKSVNSTGVFFDLPAGVAVTRNAFTSAALAQPMADGDIIYDLSGDGTLFSYQGNSAAGAFAALYSNGNKSVRAQRSENVCLSMLVSGASGYSSITNDDPPVTGSTLGAAAVTAGGKIGMTNFPSAPQFGGNALWQGFVVWSSALSAAQITALKMAAFTQFGVVPQLRDNMVAVGDSITWGSAAFNQNYPEQLPPYLSRPMAIINQGVPSATILDIDGYVVARLQQQYRAGAVNTCNLWAGTNDIYTGADAATAYARLVTLVGLIRGVGYKINMFTALPRNWSGATGGRNDTDRLAFNVLIRADPSLYDRLCDVGADPVMGPTAAYLTSTLYPDGTHPSPLGYSELIPTIAAADNALLV